MRLCKSLTKSDAKKIVCAVRKILTGAISAGGLSFSGGYKDVSGKRGEALKYLVVFHQEVCGLCQKKRIKKLMLAGRGTFYCPSCQK
jgi:formamidopyrimidine-DNA glycosylase